MNDIVYMSVAVGLPREELEQGYVDALSQIERLRETLTEIRSITESPDNDGLAVVQVYVKTAEGLSVSEGEGKA